MIPRGCRIVAEHISYVHLVIEAGVRIEAGLGDTFTHAFALQFSPSVDLGGGKLSSDDVFYDSALVRYAADGTYVSCASAGGPGEQRTSGLALSPEGRLYWAVSYLWTLKYGDQVLVEPPPSDSWFVPTLHGSAIIALPP